MTKQERIRQMDDEIAKTVIERTDLTYPAIAKMFGVGPNYIGNLVVARKLRRPRGLGSPVWKSRLKEN